MTRLMNEQQFIRNMETIDSDRNEGRKVRWHKSYLEYLERNAIPDKHGKKQDILTRLTPNSVFSNFIVWADRGMLKTISEVPGVRRCEIQDGVKYCVFIDQRYDLETVAENVEASIDCKQR